MPEEYADLLLMRNFPACTPWSMDGRSEPSAGDFNDLIACLEGEELHKRARAAFASLDTPPQGTPEVSPPMNRIG